MFSGKVIADHLATVWGLGPVAPSTSVPDYVSLKNAIAAEAVIVGLNASTVTGSAITLKQASAVANTGEKALSFTKYFVNADTANSDAFAEATAASNTFTTTNTNSRTFVYRIPIDPATLDTANSFDCIRVGTGDAVNSTVAVYYNIISRYGGAAANFPSTIID